jgi:Tol biopolymer transport system component
VGKQTCTVLVWLLLAAVLACCGPGGTEQAPTVTPEPTGEQGPIERPAGTPEASNASPECQGRIAFVGRNNGERGVSVIHADGTGLVRLTDGDGPEQSPSWSPDGTRILFTRHVGNTDIYTVRSDGSELVRLTEHPSRESSPSWSPDGSQVLFASTSGYATELLLVSAEGGEAVPVTDSVAHKPDSAWSPDGTRIAFTMLDGYNQGDIYVMAAPDDAGAGGGSPTNLTKDPAHDCCVAWSPDSERILFLSSRNGKGAGLWLGASGQGAQSRDVFIRGGQGGDRTAAHDAVRPVTTVVPEQPRDIYVINADGSGLARLTDGTGREKQASWSPDGRRIAFISDRDGNDEVYVMTGADGAMADAADAGGSKPTRLTDSPEDDSYPTWSPDGRCLAFVSRRADAWGLYIMNADGSGLKKLVDSVDWGSSPGWAP